MNMCSFSAVNVYVCTHVRVCGWQQVQLSPPHFLNCPLASAVLSAAASLRLRKPEEEQAAASREGAEANHYTERETGAGGYSW